MTFGPVMGGQTPCYAAADTDCPQVLFSGEDLFHSGFDGSYTAELRLIDQDGRLLDEAQFTTTPFNHAAFGELPARLTGVMEMGVDEDGNGSFDRLTVDVLLDVAQAMRYGISVWLVSADGELIAAEQGGSALTGPGSISVGLDDASEMPSGGS